MAVVEYKLHIVGHRGQRQQPMWVRNSGNFVNPDDNTMIGWIVDNPKYYIPDTVLTLTKEELVLRQLGIHANHPQRVYIGSEEENDAAQHIDAENWRNATDAEVRADAEAWYDQYVIDCASIEK
jgi:hypothetical protein